MGWFGGVVFIVIWRDLCVLGVGVRLVGKGERVIFDFLFLLLWILWVRRYDLKLV